MQEITVARQIIKFKGQLRSMFGKNKMADSKLRFQFVKIAFKHSQRCLSFAYILI